MKTGLKMSTKLIERIILYPLIIILAFLLFRSCERANTLQDTLKQREALELSEKYWQKYADSLKENIQIRIDTLYITRTKLKTKNNTLFLEQQKVSNMEADSAYAFFKNNTGKIVVAD